MRTLYLTFDLPLEPRDIAGFRAAIANSAGWESDLLHNHRPDGTVHYRYPLIQYRADHHRAAILGIEVGASTLADWFCKTNGQIFWNDQYHPLNIATIYAQQYSLCFHQTPKTYTLSHWIALNQENYQHWSQTPELNQRIKILEKALVAHILTFCRAVGWQLSQHLETCLQNIRATRRTQLFGNPMIAFDVTFLCNLQIPPQIGLGRGVSHGFGICKPKTNKHFNHL